MDLSAEPCLPDADVTALSNGGRWIDFGASFIRYIVTGGSTTQHQRMSIAAIGTLTVDGMPADAFVLGGELLGGRLYASDHLVVTPTYTYKMVLSRTGHALYREYLPPKDRPDTLGENDQLFVDCRWALEAHDAERLTNAADVVRATLADRPISGFACFDLPGSKRKFSLQFPVGFFSVRDEQPPKFQAEAGPVLVPDRGFDTAVGGLNIAHIFFNRFDEADVVLWRSTGPGESGSRFFSGVRKIKADLSFLVRADRK